MQYFNSSISSSLSSAIPSPTFSLDIFSISALCRICSLFSFAFATEVATPAVIEPAAAIDPVINGINKAKGNKPPIFSPVF